MTDKFITLTADVIRSIALAMSDTSDTSLVSNGERECNAMLCVLVQEIERLQKSKKGG